MSGMDASARLRRALFSDAAARGVTLTLGRGDSTGWASATFTGARHALELDLLADDAAELWLEGLPEADLPLPGHLVADLKVVAMRQTAAMLTVTLEILTVED